MPIRAARTKAPAAGSRGFLLLGAISTRLERRRFAALPPVGITARILALPFRLIVVRFGVAVFAILVFVFAFFVVTLAHDARERGREDRADRLDHRGVFVREGRFAVAEKNQRRERF